MMDSRKRQAAYQAMVPGGAHTYSKGADQFPRNAPAFIDRGKGARVWADDGREFVDWSMGLTSVSLGHAHEPVLNAIRDELTRGVNFQRPSMTEYRAAEFLLEHLGGPHEMVKFAKNGSTVTTAAIKLARGATGRRKVFYCRSHPFFSYDDWFIGTTACDLGVPAEGRDLVQGFDYNDAAGLEQLFAEQGQETACLIMEARNGPEPQDDFLQLVQRLCRQYAVVFILDEMVTGFKWDLFGAQRTYGLEPDLSTWGKGMANGFSACALTGRREIMQQGGLDEGRERLFLISTTHGAETCSLAAMMATIAEMATMGHIADNIRRARDLRAELEALITAAGLGEYLDFGNHPAMWHLYCRNRQGQIDLPLKTLLMQELIARGILWQGIFYNTPSHGESEVSQTLEAFAAALPIYRQALEAGSVEGLLQGPAIKPVFRKYN